MSGNIESWQPTDEFFAQSTEIIAEKLKEVSANHEEALARLTDYLDHPTTNLTDDDKERLLHVKVKLRHLYETH